MPHLTMAIALPFVINLPDDRYTVVLEDGERDILELSNQMWALRTQTEFTQDLALPGCFGTRDDLEQIIRAGSLANYTTEKLRTWLQEISELPVGIDKDTASDIASKRHSGFLSAVNQLIQAYRVVRRDPFAQPVSPTLCLVYRWADLGEGLVQLPIRLGKVPHFLRQPWMLDASDDVAQELRDFAAGNKSIPFHRIQLIQARAHLERSETRAAIMEARGAFENAIAAKTAECLRAQGSTETDIEDWLAKHEGVADRQKKLATLTGRTLEAEDKPLRDRLLHWRKTLRHLVIHADLVPTVGDAERACGDHEQAVAWIDALAYRP